MAIYSFDEKKQASKKPDYQKIVGCVFVAVSVLCLFCLITKLVPFVKNFLLGIAGLFCYPFFITMMAIGFALIAHKKYVMPKKYGIFISLSIIAILAILQLILVKNTNLNFGQYLAACYEQKTTAGGILLGLIVAPVLYLLNRLGAYIIFIAAAIVFVALTVDYIHYLSKNQTLINAVKVDTTKPVEQKNMTVRELEAKLKQEKEKSVLLEEESKKQPKPKEEVKISLNAKIEEEETNEQQARRKLGLLASSKIDQVDNSKYFATAEPDQPKAPEKIVDTRSYILSGNNKIELSEYSKNQLSKIQSNFMSLKNGSKEQEGEYENEYSAPSGVNNNQYSFTEPNYTNNSNYSLSNRSNNYSNQTMPNKVVHEESSSYVFPLNRSESKSTIGSRVKDEENYGEPLNDNSKADTLNDYNPSEKLTNTSNYGEVAQENESVFNASDNQYAEISSEGESNLSTMDVENFTNNILASLNKEARKNNIVEEKPNIDAPSVSFTSPANMFKETVEVPVEPIMPKKDITYVKPPIELLTTESMDLSLMNQDVIMKREELEITLDTFGIPAKVIGVVIGPAVTRYELEMPAGVSVKRLTTLQEDIAYSLQSNGAIRLETPIPGRRAVGIEVPNEKIATVGLKDILLSPEFMESKSHLSVALGKDISGEVKTFSLIKIPHLLVAGTTGSGKSVCINAIILSLIYRYSPDEVKFILIDPKRVEFSMYNNLPHLLTPTVITDSEKALNALSWCVDEMERRFIIFANARVKNLEEYNSSEAVLEGKADKIPYIIFIIDELADLLMTAKKDAEDCICRILQKARAAGIHMILATQRPSVDVVTGKIKANLNARICFALMTFADSKTVLDQGGADKLLGKGDMLFMSSDTGVPKRIQGCFVTTKEIDDVVSFIKENNGDYEFDSKIEQAINNPPKNDVVAQVDGEKSSKDGFDSLMPEVLKAVIESGHASISMIQRKFLVGFPRAGKIIDQMEAAGFISPSDGSKSRSVYITMDEYEKMYGDSDA